MSRQTKKSACGLARKELWVAKIRVRSSDRGPRSALKRYVWQCVSRQRRGSRLETSNESGYTKHGLRKHAASGHRKGGRAPITSECLILLWKGFEIRCQCTCMEDLGIPLRVKPSALGDILSNVLAPVRNMRRLNQDSWFCFADRGGTDGRVEFVALQGGSK